MLLDLEREVVPEALLVLALGLAALPPLGEPLALLELELQLGDEQLRVRLRELRERFFLEDAVGVQVEGDYLVAQSVPLMLVDVLPQVA